MNTYSATDLTLIISAIFGGMALLISTWKTNAKVDANTAVTEATAKKVDTIETKAAVIEGHVNSKESKYVEQLTALNRENDLLRQMIADKQQTANMLAQAMAVERAHTGPSSLVSLAPLVTPGLPVAPVAPAPDTARTDAADARDVRADARDARADAQDARADHSADTLSTTAKADAASTKASLHAIKESTAAIDRNTR